MREREAKKEKESVCFATFDVRWVDPGAPRGTNQTGPLEGARAEERHQAEAAYTRERRVCEKELAIRTESA